MPHPESEHGLRVQLAMALADAANLRVANDTARATTEKWLSVVEQLRETLNATLLERDALRAALTDIVTLCMDVPATWDWRAKVGDKARKALFGEAAWEQK